MKEVDARGLSCPQPVMLTLEAISGADEDELVVIVDNPTARENVIRAAGTKGWRPRDVKVEVDAEGEVYRVELVRAG